MDARPQHTCTFLKGMNWYTYLDLESRLLNISKFITFDMQNRNTWSETNAALLLLIGSAIDTFFRDMTNCPQLLNEASFRRIRRNVGRRRSPRWNIHDFREAFNPIFELSENRVQVPFGLSSYPNPQDPFIHPFREFSDPNGIPDWWNTYNGVKHDYYATLHDANLDRVINSLGGLLILHALHKCSQTYLIQIGKIRDRFNSIQTDDLIDAFSKTNTGYPLRWTMLRDCPLNTQLFVFQYRPGT